MSYFKPAVPSTLPKGAPPVRHYLQFSDFSTEEYGYLLERAALIKQKFKTFQRHQPLVDRTLAMIFAHSGDSWFWGAGLVILWLFCVARQWGVYELFWISALAALVMTLKFIIRRRRPEGRGAGAGREAALGARGDGLSNCWRL